MQNQSSWKGIRNAIQIAFIVLFCAATFALEFVCFVDHKDALQKTMLCKLIQQLCGATAAILLMIRLNIRLFGKVQKWLFLLPCLLVAIDNFQFSAFLQGKMQLVHNKPTEILLFAGYCLSVGLFEECIFRGIIFGVLASIFPQNKKGFLLTFVISSSIFGLAHLFNGFSVGTLLQVGYSVLTGGLFAFCLIKTKNIFCSAFIHALYNFCGLLFGVFDPKQGLIGLGGGVVFDVGTVVTMTIISVFVGLFIIFKTIMYSSEERIELYEKLGIHKKKSEEAE